MSLQRVLKILRHYPGSQLLWRALAMSWNALLVPLVFLVVGALIFGALVYYCERLELDDESGGFVDIPEVHT